MRKTANDSLEGVWISSAPEDSENYDIEYSIRKKHGNWTVRARDWNDGEKLDIQNLRWNEKSLSFDIYMSSTGWFSRLQFRLKSTGTVEAKFIVTISSVLKRIDHRSANYRKVLSMADNPRTVRFKNASLEGVWGGKLPGLDRNFVRGYLIEGRGNSFAVEGIDLNDGERFVMSDIRYSNNELVFKSRMPSTKRTGLNRFRLLSGGRLESKFTYQVTEELKKSNEQQKQGN